VVPLPPLADQQANSTGFLRDGARRRDRGKRCGADGTDARARRTRGNPDTSPRAATGSAIGSPAVEAAFFDLDKTVIAKASMVAFGRPLYREGLLSRWLLLRALYGQLVYLWLGADEARLAKMRDAALRLTKGWQHENVRRIVRETLTEVIEPIVFEEALDLIRQHRADGHLVVIISASPEEIVEPLAEYLGADVAIGTQAELDADGRYSGQLKRYSYGPAKAVAIRELAAARDIDLAGSYAYSDSVTDIPMMEVVGHPVAVNPDRPLLRIARERGWEVRRFVKPVRLRDRVPMPSPAAAATGGGLTLTAITAAVVWWWLRRQPADPPPPWWRPRRWIRPLGASWPRWRRG
jgi:HAD superfamily hydrolase (TIGR01490 family)